MVGFLPNWKAIIIAAEECIKKENSIFGGDTTPTYRTQTLSSIIEAANGHDGVTLVRSIAFIQEQNERYSEEIIRAGFESGVDIIKDIRDRCMAKEATGVLQDDLRDLGFTLEEADAIIAHWYKDKPEEWFDDDGCPPEKSIRK